MITQKQHKEICRKIDELRSDRIDIFSYNGARVTGVDYLNGEIKLDDGTILTNRSYKPETTLDEAWEKFEIRYITLLQVKRLREIRMEWVTDLAVKEKEESL